MASAPRPDHLVWERTTVSGRPALYGVAGDGLPVLFLHGWGLGQHSYKRALSRIVRMGTRVYAPALQHRNPQGAKVVGGNHLPVGRVPIGGSGRAGELSLDHEGPVADVQVPRHRQAPEPSVVLGLPPTRADVRPAQEFPEGECREGIAGELHGSGFKVEAFPVRFLPAGVR